MKRIALIAGALLLLSSPVLAYVQAGSLGSSPKVSRDERHHGLKDHSDDNWCPDPGTGGHPEGDDGHPARPVPEPGTMALASMGLVAIGLAFRNRRAR